SAPSSRRRRRAHLRARTRSHAPSRPGRTGGAPPRAAGRGASPRVAVRARHVFLPAALVLAVLISGNVVAVFAASIPIVSGGKVGRGTQALLPAQLRPLECTGTVSSVLVRTGNTSYAGSNVLVVGGPANDNINQTAGGY